MSIDVELGAVRKRLSRRAHERFSGEAKRWAAVAAVLRQGPQGTELLMIRRAEREGDPWSGHIALPGGHAHAADENLQATAMRETLEEVGLDLGEHELLGPLDEHAATTREVFIGLVVAPFVFALRGEATLRLNHEVAEALWAPLGRITRGEANTVKDLVWEGQPVQLPGYRVGEHVVWGMTRRILQNFFATLDEHDGRSGL